MSGRGVVRAAVPSRADRELTLILNRYPVTWLAIYYYASCPTICGGMEMCSHAAWVLKFQEGGCTVPKHLKLCVSFAVLQCLARLRLGWHQLRVQTDRLKKADAR
jgi:hypothetical protein